MTLYLNGSPRLQKSNSNSFLKDIGATSIKYIYKNSFNNILKNIDNIDTIVFSFPLYVDSPPSKVIELMEYIENNKIDLTNKNIYTIINCGFLESEHNKTASVIMENFSSNNKAIYKGSFIIGAGEIIGKRNNNFLFRLISIPYAFKIKKFNKCISKKKAVKLNTSLQGISKHLYMFVVNNSFKSTMKKNNCIYELVNKK